MIDTNPNLAVSVTGGRRYVAVRVVNATPVAAPPHGQSCARATRTETQRHPSLDGTVRLLSA
jgi:hypothetical protein